MNARSQTFELSVEGRQADEVVASIFHTVLFHRSLGKFTYTSSGNYTVGTVGYTDVDCNFIDLTYVCCSSVALDNVLRREISRFSETLRHNESSGTGQISLEFFQKKPSNSWFPTVAENITWEVWNVRLQLISLNNEGERQIYRESVGELLTDKILYITDIINTHNYLPKMPKESDLGLIFDTSYRDVQPYLFNVKFALSRPFAGPSSAGTSVGSAVKKLLKETLSFS